MARGSGGGTYSQPCSPRKGTASSSSSSSRSTITVTSSGVASSRNAAQVVLHLDLSSDDDEGKEGGCGSPQPAWCLGWLP